MKLRGWIALSIVVVPAVSFALACSSSSDGDDTVIPFEAGPDVLIAQDGSIGPSTDGGPSADAGPCALNPGAYQVHNSVEDGSTPASCITPADGGTETFPLADAAAGTCAGTVTSSTTQGPEGCTYFYSCSGASGSTTYSLTVAPDGNSGALSFDLDGPLQSDGGQLVCNFLETYTRE